jgi:hypothetical protein
VKGGGVEKYVQLMTSKQPEKLDLGTYIR